MSEPRIDCTIGLVVFRLYASFVVVVVVVAAAAAAAKTADAFERTLCGFIRSIVGVPEELKHDIVSAIGRFDYGGSDAALLASVPGVHRSNTRYGLFGLQKLLGAKSPFHHNRSSSRELVCQCSSLGSLDEAWMEDFKAATSTSSCQAYLVLPTVNQVRESLEVRQCAHNVIHVENCRPTLLARGRVKPRTALRCLGFRATRRGAAFPSRWRTS